MLRQITNTKVYENMVKEYQDLYVKEEITAREAVDSQLSELQSFISYDYVKEMDYIDKKINNYYNLYSTRICMVLSNNINMQTYLNDLLLAMKGFGTDRKTKFIDSISGCFGLQSYKYIGRKSIERRKKHKPNTKSGAITTSSLSDEERTRLAKELLYEHPDHYSIKQVTSYFDNLFAGRESVIPDETVIRTREDVMMTAAGIIYSGTEGFPYEIEFLDGTIETEIAKISNIRIKKKKLYCTNKNT